MEKRQEIDTWKETSSRYGWIKTEDGHYESIPSIAELNKHLSDLTSIIYPDAATAYQLYESEIAELERRMPFDLNPWRVSSYRNEDDQEVFIIRRIYSDKDKYYMPSQPTQQTIDRVCKVVHNLKEGESLEIHTSETQLGNKILHSFKSEPKPHIQSKRVAYKQVDQGNLPTNGISVRVYKSSEWHSQWNDIKYVIKKLEPRSQKRYNNRIKAFKEMEALREKGLKLGKQADSLESKHTKIIQSIEQTLTQIATKRLNLPKDFIKGYRSDIVRHLSNDLIIAFGCMKNEKAFSKHRKEIIDFNPIPKYQKLIDAIHELYCSSQNIKGKSISEVQHSHETLSRLGIESWEFNKLQRRIKEYRELYKHLKIKH